MITILCIHVVHINQIMNALRSGQVRSGQVRSECFNCTFRANCCSARLSRVQVLALAGFSVRNRKKKGGGSKGGTACTGGYKGVRAVQPESVAGGGWFEVLWNLECPVGLSQNKNMCAFISMKEIWRTLDVLPKNKENCGAT